MVQVVSVRLVGTGGYMFNYIPVIVSVWVVMRIDVVDIATCCKHLVIEWYGMTCYVIL